MAGSRHPFGATTTLPDAPLVHLTGAHGTGETSLELTFSGNVTWAAGAESGFTVDGDGGQTQELNFEDPGSGTTAAVNLQVSVGTLDHVTVSSEPTNIHAPGGIHVGDVVSVE